MKNQNVPLVIPKNLFGEMALRGAQMYKDGICDSALYGVPEEGPMHLGKRLHTTATYGEGGQERTERTLVPPGHTLLDSILGSGCMGT